MYSISPEIDNSLRDKNSWKTTKFRLLKRNISNGHYAAMGKKDKVQMYKCIVSPDMFSRGLFIASNPKKFILETLTGI